MGGGTPLLEESLVLYKQLGDKIGQADTIGWLSIDHSNLDRAIAYAQEGVELHRELGDLSGIAFSLNILARLTMWNGDFSSPVPWLEEVLTISRQLSDHENEGQALMTFGTLAH